MSQVQGRYRQDAPANGMPIGRARETDPPMVDGPPPEEDADLAAAVRATGRMRTAFYIVVLLIALGGQVSGAMEALAMPWYVALPAVGALELGGMVVLANADVRRRLGEHATLSRLLSAGIAGGAVAFNWLAHDNHLEGGFYGGMSLLGYLVWLMNTENKRRDRLRAKRQLPPTPPAYEVVGHWLRHPLLTRRARSLAKAAPRLGLYGSLDAARAQVRSERRQDALAKVLRRKIRRALDGTTADIAVAVYDLDEIARRLAERADYDGLTALIAADLAPARVFAGNLPSARRRWWRRGGAARLDATALASAGQLFTDVLSVPAPSGTDHENRPAEPAPAPAPADESARAVAGYLDPVAVSADPASAGPAAERVEQVPTEPLVERPAPDPARVAVPGQRHSDQSSSGRTRERTDPERTGQADPVDRPDPGRPRWDALTAEVSALLSPAQRRPARPAPDREPVSVRSAPDREPVSVRPAPAEPEVVSLGGQPPAVPHPDRPLPDLVAAAATRTLAPSQVTPMAAVEPARSARGVASVPSGAEGSLRARVYGVLDEAVPVDDDRDNSTLTDLVVHQLRLSPSERTTAGKYVRGWRAEVVAGRRTPVGERRLRAVPGQ
jgi:hypothetical protein